METANVHTLETLEFGPFDLSESRVFESAYKSVFCETLMQGQRLEASDTASESWSPSWTPRIPRHKQRARF